MFYTYRKCLKTDVWRKLGLVMIELFFAQTISDKTFGTKSKNLVKLDKTRKFSSLLLRVSWLLLSKTNICNGDRAIGFVSNQIWDFSKIFEFSYFWRMGPVIKHCKVPKYYDQDCLKLLLLLSTLQVMIQVPRKSAHIGFKILSEN